MMSLMSEWRVQLILWVAIVITCFPCNLTFGKAEEAAERREFHIHSQHNPHHHLSDEPRHGHHSKEFHGKHDHSGGSTSTTHLHLDPQVEQQVSNWQDKSADTDVTAGYVNDFPQVPPSESEQQEKLLLQHLMQGYERDVRPVRNASQPVVVRVGITLTQIFDMDEKNQTLTTNVWLDQEWNDELLRWEPKEFGGLEMIRIPCERIWLPDIVLYNNADDYTTGYMPSRAMVKYDGNVFWPPPTKFRSTCAVDVTYFPFDDQTCIMKLGSWTYNGAQVDVTNRTADVDLSHYVVNGEWDLIQAEIKRNVIVYPCCPEQFPDVTITLVIRRKTLYYIYNIVLPCMMLSALTLLVFCLPPDSGEKIALGITVLLLFSVFMLAISEALPETSESIPLIGIYLTAVMGITSISVIVTVVVLNLHYLGPRVRPVPVWLKCLLPEDDVRFIRQKSPLIPASSREPKSGSLKRSFVYLSQGGNCSSSGHGLCPPSGEAVVDSLRNESSAIGNHNAGMRFHNSTSSPPPPSHPQQPTTLLRPCLPKDEVPSCDELMDAVRYLMNIQEQVETQNMEVAEWRLVAQAVDRFLFWIVSVMTIVSSMVLLLILPLYKRSTFYGPATIDGNETVEEGL